MSGAPWYRWQGGDLLLSLKVQARAGQDAFDGPQHDRLRVRITAPPVDGKANAHLIGWLAGQFGVARSAVTIEAGRKGRIKQVRVRSPSRLPDLVALP